jgi:hypothetical protein
VQKREVIRKKKRGTVWFVSLPYHFSKYLKFVETPMPHLAWPKHGQPKLCTHPLPKILEGLAWAVYDYFVRLSNMYSQLQVY